MDNPLTTGSTLVVSLLHLQLACKAANCAFGFMQYAGNLLETKLPLIIYLKNFFQYYFPALKLCYEHYTRGPCEAGLLYAYNHTSQVTHCMCDEDLVNYHGPTQQCFQFGNKGPCQKGQVWIFSVNYVKT